MHLILIFIYSIFSIIFMMFMLVNIMANHNSYSKNLKIHNVMIGTFYLAYTALLITYSAQHFYEDEISLSLILAIASFLIVTILSLTALIEFTFKKSYAKDAWKYTARHFANFDEKNRSSGWESFVLFLKISLAISVLSIFSIIILSKKISNIWFEISLVVATCHITINHILLHENRQKLLIDNIKYKFLKKLILSHEFSRIDENTKKELGAEAIKLYSKLFVENWYHKNDIVNNNAIIYEIYQRTGTNLKGRYFREPKNPEVAWSKRGFERYMAAREMDDKTKTIMINIPKTKTKSISEVNQKTKDNLNINPS